MREVIEIAFKEVPAKPEELVILRWISQHPGTSYAEIGTVYKSRDRSLVIGHLIYYRFGYFRPMITGPIQSDLLLDRDNTSGKVCYTLRSEARIAFSAPRYLELGGGNSFRWPEHKVAPTGVAILLSATCGHFPRIMNLAIIADNNRWATRVA